MHVSKDERIYEDRLHLLTSLDNNNNIHKTKIQNVSYLRDEDDDDPLLKFEFERDDENLKESKHPPGLLLMFAWLFSMSFKIHLNSFNTVPCIRSILVRMDMHGGSWSRMLVSI